MQKKTDCLGYSPGILADLYISGPMRGKPDMNYEEFAKAENILGVAGYGNFSPARQDKAKYGKNAATESLDNIRELFTLDATWITKHADGVAVLDGWEASSGARAEVALALAIGIKVATVMDWVNILAIPYHNPEWITEIPPVTPSTTEPAYKGKKGTKIERFDLVPVRPLRAVARHYGIGAKKYDDRNWELGYPWSLSFAAMMRHLSLFWGGEDIDVDPVTGEESPHLAAVAFHALSLMEFMHTHPELDDRVKES